MSTQTWYIVQVDQRDRYQINSPPGFLTHLPDVQLANDVHTCIRCFLLQGDCQIVSCKFVQTPPEAAAAKPYGLAAGKPYGLAADVSSSDMDYVYHKALPQAFALECCVMHCHDAGKQIYTLPVALCQWRRGVEGAVRGLV